MKNISIKLFVLVLSTNLLISTSESQQPPSMFPDPVFQPHLFPMPEFYIMPDTLKFLPYGVTEPTDGTPPMYTMLRPNIHPDLPACLYSLTKIDQFGNPKIYPTCTGTKVHNWRHYPPLYSGDVFPVLDQLYYFESGTGSVEKPHKAIKVLEVKYHHVSSTFLPKGQIILPLTPLDVLPDVNPIYSRNQMICRSSFQLMNTGGAVSLVKIRQIIRSEEEREEWERELAQTKMWEPTPQHLLSVPRNYAAAIYTDCTGEGYTGRENLGLRADAFQTKKEYRVGDIVISHYKDPEKSSTKDAPELAVGFKITKIVPPDPERNRVFQTVEGEKTGRLIGWVELDPTPIPVDANDKPVN